MEKCLNDQETSAFMHQFRSLTFARPLIGYRTWFHGKKCLNDQEISAFIHFFQNHFVARPLIGYRTWFHGKMFK